MTANLFESISSTQDSKMATDSLSNDKLSQPTLNINTTDPSFFDFGTPSRTGSPFQDQFSPQSPSTNMPGWGTDMNFQPLSPPHSASLEPKRWDYGFPAYPTPSNILTNIQPHNARAQYGQVTPPDDENDTESFLDRQLREQLQAENQTHDQTESSPPPPSRRQPETTTGKKRTRTNGKDGPTKRARKSNARNAGMASSAGSSNKPEDIRRSKFLERNRVAASKCRQKKKEWTQNLESRARDMQKANASLRMMVDSLRQEVVFLKGEMLRHNDCDCSQIQSFIKTAGHTFPPRPDNDRVSDLILKQETDSQAGSPASTTESDFATLDNGIAAGNEIRASLGSLDGKTRRGIVEDESALEALLTDSINRTAGDGGSAIGVSA